MQNKTLLLIFVIGLLIGSFISWYFTNKHFINLPKDIVKDSVYISVKPLEPVHKEKVSKIHLINRTAKDSTEITTQTGTKIIKQKVELSVNLDYITNTTTYDEFPLMFIEEQYKTIIKKELEYVELPFYMDGWFWSWIATTALTILFLITMVI